MGGSTYSVQSQMTSEEVLLMVCGKLGEQWWRFKCSAIEV